MHKILFFTYGMFYKKYKIELWKPKFASWTYGPVELNYRFNKESLVGEIDINSLNVKQQEFLNNLIKNLLKLSVWTLVDYSHTTKPYINGLNNKNKIIDNNEIMNSNFKFSFADKYNIRNILGFQKSNNEFYTPEEPIINLLEILQIPKSKVIWCPFDKKESNFVKILQANNYKVIYSHIDDGCDFFNYEPKQKYDLIISNPPFTKKRLLIERCEQLKKPFCLLYGTTIFSQSMGNTLNRLKFLFIQNNIKFTTNETGKTKSFQCCWVMNKKFEYYGD